MGLKIPSIVASSVAARDSAKATALDKRGMPHTWSWRFAASMHRTLCTKASITEELLRLDVEGRALLDGLHPGSNGGGKPLLGSRTLFLAHDLPPLVLEQIRLGQASRGLLLVSAEHHTPGPLALGNLAHCLFLHGLHGLHGLHCLHRFRHVG